MHFIICTFGGAHQEKWIIGTMQLDFKGNLIWFSKQDFRTLKRFFEFSSWNPKGSKILFGEPNEVSL